MVGFYFEIVNDRILGKCLEKGGGGRMLIRVVFNCNFSFLEFKG